MNIDKKLNAGQKLYLMAIAMQAEMDECGIKKTHPFRKSVTSYELWIKEQSSIVELLNSEAHAKAIHNFNVIIDSITIGDLSHEIGEFTIER